MPNEDTDRPGRAYLRRGYTDVMTMLTSDHLPESAADRRSGIPASTRPDAYAPAPPGARRPCGVEVDLTRLPSPQPAPDPGAGSIRIRGPVPAYAVTINTPNRATLQFLTAMVHSASNARQPYSAGIDTRAANEDPATADTPPIDPGPGIPPRYDRIRGAVEGSEFRNADEPPVPHLDPETSGRHLASTLHANRFADPANDPLWNAAVETILADDGNRLRERDLVNRIADRAVELGGDRSGVDAWRGEAAAVLRADKAMELTNPPGGRQGLAVTMAVVRGYHQERLNVEAFDADRPRPAESVCQHARVLAGLRTGYTAMPKSDNFGRDGGQERAATARDLCDRMDRTLAREAPMPAPERPPATRPAAGTETRGHER